MEDSISRYLDRYRKLEPPEENIKRAFAEVIKNEFDTLIDEKHIRISRGVIYVDTASHLKNRIFVKKDFLLEKLKTIIGDRSPNEIR